MEQPEEKKEVDFTNFNLEDTILAAATAQGIEIPEEKPDEVKIQQENAEIVEAAKEAIQKPVVEKKAEKEPEVTGAEVEEPAEKPVEASEKEVKEEAKKRPVVELEEEEFLSEEDLQAAEDEFMNGPVEKRVQPETTDVPADAMSEDEFIANMLKESNDQDEDIETEF